MSLVARLPDAWLPGVWLSGAWLSDVWLPGGLPGCLVAWLPGRVEPGCLVPMIICAGLFGTLSKHPSSPIPTSLFFVLQMASEIRRICTLVIEATQLCPFFLFQMASQMRRICTFVKTPPKSVWDPFFVEFCGRLGVKLGSARRQCPGRYPSSLGSARLLY